MIYPSNFEEKTGFADIRAWLRKHCLCQLGKEMVDVMAFSAKADDVNNRLNQIREFRRLMETADDFPMQYFFDLREAIARLRLEGTHLECDELFALGRTLDTVKGIVTFLTRDEENPYPSLRRLTTGVVTFPALSARIAGIFDEHGNMRDDASAQLADIRRQIAQAEGSVSRILNGILRRAQQDGLVEKDVAPTLRDGRLVIPVAPALKRKIRGIVHDESATGKTVFIEPAEVVEANNRIRELEGEERQEIVRILTEMGKEIRPRIQDILFSFRLLASVDFIQAKSALAREMEAIEPEVEQRPMIDFIHAVHPLLRKALEKQGKKAVPLDIMLTEDKRLLIISGPNAGGKSVCLKTTGLLQYMLQCGLSIPVSERSHAGVFRNIMIDIGDEQSIENDLSTYSSHLLNMKQMMRQADGDTLLLIDEFGTGTEPQIGGAIAEAVLKQFWQKKAFGVFTTHYQNLKHFADDHEGVVNGAMLYDRKEMQALFQLEIGRPGSSFAIEIARKTGIPEEVIRDASAIVGSDYIQSDKYLQDIVRDKRYWEGKRQTIHQREKDIEKAIARYDEGLTDINQQRKQILKKAKEEAEALLKEANKRIENTIREIREQQAEKESTKRLREDLEEFSQEVSAIDRQKNDEWIEKKMQQILARRQRKEERKQQARIRKEKETQAAVLAPVRQESETPAAEIHAGDTVRIKGTTSTGKVESVKGHNAVVIFGDVRSRVKTEQLTLATAKKKEEKPAAYRISKTTRETIDEHQKNFHHELDLRGMRGDEALLAVQHFIDDAILVGMSQVRILHGKGDGILRQLVRQYLASEPNVRHFADERIQLGGSGITVVEF